MNTNEITRSITTGSFSTDDIFRPENPDGCLTTDLNTIEANITALQNGKANTNHTHSGYLSENDAIASFAPINHIHSGYLSEDDAITTFAPVDHTHTNYSPVDHTHSDLEGLIEALDAEKSDASHTHAQADVTGLVDRLAGIDTAISELQNSSGSSDVQPMIIASMHLGKIDNNNGSEVTSSSRICSEPFAVQNGKSYWQVNDKAVAMYALIYDADEVFLAYLGSFDSGAEIVVNNANAAYMRLGSKLGEYDLTNEFRIYDVNPNGSGSSGTTIDAYTKTESDARFAPIIHSHDNYAAVSHTHDNYAATDHTHTELHTHSNKTVLDGITAEKISAWDAGTGSTATIDAYTKTESDSRFAPVTHAHAEYMTETAAGNAFAPIVHSHANYAAQIHTHSYNDLTDVPTDQGSYTHPATHPASMITGLATVATSGKYSDLSDKPISLPADGGDADTVGGKYPSAFANVSHSHSEYLSLAGGTLTGNLNVGGIFRVNNQQAVYNSGDMMTLATNNLPTMIAGSKIYSKQTIQVSSDERLKENIEYADPDECLEFINDLEVKTFNYKGSDIPCIGVIAQDLQGGKFEKFFVSVQPGEEGYLAVKAADLVFPLIAAVQNLSAEIDYLKAKI